MKKYLLLPISFLLLTGTANAQSAKQAAATQTAVQQKQETDKAEIRGIPVEVYVKGETKQMINDLKLNTEQSKQVFDVNEKAAAKSVAAERMTDPKQVAAANEKIHEFKAEQFKKILTKEQYEKWEQMSMATGAKR